MDYPLVEVIRNELKAAISALELLEAQLEDATGEAALRDGQGWRPVTEPPENGQEVQIVLNAWWFEKNDQFKAGWYFTDDGDYHAPDFPVQWRPATAQE